LDLIDRIIGRLKEFNLIILACIVAVTPLIFYLGVVAHEGEVTSLWGSTFDFNFSSFYKMNWLIFSNALLLLTFLAYTVKNKPVKTYYYTPILVFAVLAGVSSYLSEYSSAVIRGFPGRYENIYVLLGYILLTIAAMNIIDNKKYTKFMFRALFISTFILGIHGMLQYFGFDILATDFGRSLFTPEGKEVFVQHLSFVGDNRVYSTMGNPNYVGSYGAMVVILLLGLYLNARDKRKVYGLGFLNVLMFAYMVGSKSRAGMIGFLAGMFFLVLVMRKQIISNWRQVLVILMAFVVIFLGMDAYSVEDLLGEIISPTPEDELVEEEIIISPITGVESDGNKLTLKTSDNNLNLILEENSLQFTDMDGNNIQHYSYPVTERYYLFGEEYRYHSFDLNLMENEIVWRYDDKKANFKLIDDEFRMQGMHREYFEIKDVPAWGFDGYERLGSSRGYIWSRTLPLLRETLLIGHGPDTYAFYFPQNDVVGKLRFLRSPRILVDKPHNMYLQKAVNTGLVSLLALMSMWGYYLMQSLVIYWNADYNRWENRAGAAVMASVAAYLATGVFNDSVVSVAPVFWVLLGVGISMNILIKRSQE